MATPAAPSRARPARPAPWIALACGLGLVAAFALGGPTQPLGMLAVAAALLVCAIAAPARHRPWFLPLVFTSVLFDQVGRGFFVYEVAAAAVAVVGLALTLQAGTREAWRLARPGLLVVAYLVVPWLAVPARVVSLESFLGMYKLMLGWAAMFLALRRLVPRAQSNVLLWIFPFVALLGSLQLALKTHGLGAQLVTRFAMRNFYTTLPWGRSDFVSAVMEVCLCGCVLLLLLDRRPVARAIVVVCGLSALGSFLVLLSRAGALGLVVFALVLVLGARGRRAVAAGLGALAVGAAGLLTPGGQALLGRFSDPRESASIFMRLVLWATSWDRFLGSPLTGVGLNQARYQHDLLGANWGGNLLLDTLAEQGILGGLLLVVIVVAAFRLAARAEPAVHARSLQMVRLASVGLLVEWIFHGSVEPTINGPALAVPMVFFLAWLTLQDPRARPAQPPPAR